MRGNDIFKLAPGPVDCNTATFLHVSDAEPGKLTGKRGSNFSLRWYAKCMEVQVMVLPLACWLVTLD